MTEITDKRLAAWQAGCDAALRKAEQLASIADDWDLDKVEIDGEWISTWDLKKEFVAARTGWPACIGEVRRLRKVETAAAMMRTAINGMFKEVHVGDGKVAAPTAIVRQLRPMMAAAKAYDAAKKDNNNDDHSR